jgi:hypothetical protein
MKTLLLILMSTFLCVNALGQDYLIDLEKQPISLPDRNFYVSRVIDARPVKSAIGQVQRGMTNGKANVHFRSGLEKEIQACLNHNLPPRNDLKPVILKVLKLKIYERTQLSAESATAELVVQFFTPRGEMSYPSARLPRWCNAKALMSLSYTTTILPPPCKSASGSCLKAIGIKT